VTELADTSAWAASVRDADVRRTFDELVASGRVATCDAVIFELLHGARNGREFSDTRTSLGLLPQCPIGRREWQRALDVYEMLAHRGGMHQRQVKRVDLLVAAAASSADMAVLHYDADFDVIAEITGQPMRWIAPRGSL
jgi:predicted nucleic acid-binding protein